MKSSLQLRASRIVAVGLLAGACGLAVGASKTTGFNATATVASNCSIASASTMAFGIYVPGGGDIDQSSTIAVRCSNAVGYGIGLSVGSGTGSSFAQRTMTSGTVAGELQYNLYTTVGRTTEWRNPGAPGATPNSQGGTGTGLGNTINHTVHGRLQDSAISQAALPASNYLSTITVTINY